MSANDSLGDRMKAYEAVSTARTLMPFAPGLVRVDGRAFHTYTRRYNRPFDERFAAAMDLSALALLNEFGARFAFVQSDEVSLLFEQAHIKAELPFGGRTQKLESVIASAMTGFFLERNTAVGDEDFAMFDARAWSVPNREEAANYFLWRERDATRNSISALAQEHFSHRELQGKSTRELIRLLEEKRGVRWEDLPARQKRGRFITKGGFYEMPPFGRVVNRVGVLFRDEIPAEVTDAESD